MRWLDGITNSLDLSLSKLWGLVMNREAGVLQSTGSQKVGHDRVTELSKNCCHPVKATVCHSQTHLGKHCMFEKTHGCWISPHYCQFGLPAPEFSEEALCLDLLTGISYINHLGDVHLLVITLWSSPCGHLVKVRMFHTRMCHSQTYLGKHFGCLRKHVGAESLFTTVSIGCQLLTLLMKHCALISLLRALPIEHIGW